MTDDLDDLIGSPASVPPKRRGRPPGVKNKPKPKPLPPPPVVDGADDDAYWNALPPDAVPDATVMRRPITRTGLATLLGKEPRRLVNQLEKCPPIAYGKKGEPLYDLKVALSYCLEPPVGAIESYIKSQSSTTLPPMLNKAYWEAQRAKQLVMKAAGDLWATQDVLDVLGRTAINIKDTVQLWIEDLPGKASMTSEQYNALRRATDDLLADIHQRLVDMPRERQTRPVSAEIEAEMNDGANDGVKGDEP